MSREEVLKELEELDEKGLLFRNFDSIRKTCEPLSPLWGDFLYKEHITSIVGDPGACKTTLWYALTVRLCRGLPFLGFPPETEIRVIGCDWESSDSLIGSRAELVDEGNKETPNFEIFNNSEYTLPDILPLLMKRIDKGGFNVLQIDNQTTAFNTADENDNSEGRKQMKLLRHITKETGVAIIIYHHPSKANLPGQRKGSGAFVRARMADIMFNINLVEGYPDLVQLECAKDRLAGKKGDVKYIRLDSGDFILLNESEVPLGLGMPISNKPIDLAQREIVAMLRLTEELSRGDIVARLCSNGSKESTVDKGLRECRRLGRIEVVPGKYGYYRMRSKR